MFNVDVGCPQVQPEGVPATHAPSSRYPNLAEAPAIQLAAPGTRAGRASAFLSQRVKLHAHVAEACGRAAAASRADATAKLFMATPTRDPVRRRGSAASASHHPQQHGMLQSLLQLCHAGAGSAMASNTAPPTDAPGAWPPTNWLRITPTLLRLEDLGPQPLQTAFLRGGPAHFNSQRAELPVFSECAIVVEAVATAPFARRATGSDGGSVDSGRPVV